MNIASASSIVSKWVEQYRHKSSQCQLLFVSGAQGIGKSTIVENIAASSGGKILALSLDDFYLTKPERKVLAESVHPLMQMRGAPGTHDLSLMHDTLDALVAPTSWKPVLAPLFHKAIDDRVSSSNWRAIEKQPDVIIIEGWMMGVLPDPSSPVSAPVNDIEAEDADGRWRRYQEDQLSREYAKLWDRADSFFHLDAPNFECVLQWRLQQEQSNLALGDKPLSDAQRSWVSRFIQHYERLTRRMLAGRRRTGACLRVDASRTPIEYTPDPNAP